MHEQDEKHNKELKSEKDQAQDRLSSEQKRANEILDKRDKDHND